jgi:hypothetical protein
LRWRRCLASCGWVGIYLPWACEASSSDTLQWLRWLRCCRALVCPRPCPEGLRLSDLPCCGCVGTLPAVGAVKLRPRTHAPCTRCAGLGRSGRTGDRLAPGGARDEPDTPRPSPTAAARGGSISGRRSAPSRPSLPAVDQAAGAPGADPAGAPGTGPAGAPGRRSGPSGSRRSGRSEHCPGRSSSCGPGGPGGCAAATPVSPPVSATATSADATNVRIRTGISFG